LSLVRCVSILTTNRSKTATVIYEARFDNKGDEDIGKGVDGYCKTHVLRL
jgi:hypothetical protein